MTCCLVVVLLCPFGTVPVRGQDKGNAQLAKELAELRSEVKALKIEISAWKGAERERTVAELKWAKGILADFFRGASDNTFPASARALLSSEDLQKESRDDDWGWRFVKGWTLTREEILEDEAVFQGTLNKGEGTLEHDFVIRITKGKQERVWRIVYLHMRERKKEK
jgi:hypothetical protein